jgi:hypothetical protein
VQTAMPRSWRGALFESRRVDVSASRRPKRGAEWFASFLLMLDRETGGRTGTPAAFRYAAAV